MVSIGPVKNIIVLCCMISLISLHCVSTHHIYSISSEFQPEKSFILVFPFENLSSHQYGGDIVTANFITELRRVLPAKIVDADFYMTGENEPNADQEPLTDLSLLNMYGKIKMAIKKKADFIITGKVTEFRYKKGLGEEPVVGLNVQMIQVKKREIIWHASISVAKGFIGIGEQALNYYSQKAVSEIINGLQTGVYK